MTNKQRIAAFLNSYRVFDLFTPACIKNNYECIKATIDRDIDSVRYTNYGSSSEIENYTISKALEKGYVLHGNSPGFLAVNYRVVKNSISLDVNSADYVSWGLLNYRNSAEEMDELIDILVKKGYVLHRHSPDFLKEKYKIVKKIISLNAKSADYVKWDLLEKKISCEQMDELLDLLIQKGYVLHRRSPRFLAINYTFVKNLVSINPANIDYVDLMLFDNIESTGEIDELIDIFVEKGYVLYWNSPDYLKGIYKLVKNSISLDFRSADYVDWDILEENNTEKEIDELIDILIQKGYVLNGDSDKYLTSNYKIIMNSIDRDVYSTDYVKWDTLEPSISDEEKNELINTIVQKGYILHKKSASILKINYDLVKSSISLDVTSAEYVDWSGLVALHSAEEMDELIDILTQKGYVLNGDSDKYLTGNYKIAKSSIDISVESIDYVDWYTLEPSISEEEKNELINTLVQKGYILHKSSVSILKKNYELVKSSINLDVNSADFVDWEKLADCNSVEAVDELIDILIQNGYAFNENSPSYLWGVYKLVKVLISLDISDVDCVDWDYLANLNSAEEMDELIDILVQKGYVLNGCSSYFLARNYKLAKNSINLDVNSAEYVEWWDLVEFNSVEAVNELIDILIQQGYVLYEYSPKYLWGIYKLVKNSISLDVSNVAYVLWGELDTYNSEKAMDELIDLVIQKGYVLFPYSPDYLKGVYKLVKNSISLDVYLADYANWKELDIENSAEEIDELIDILIEKGYIFRGSSLVYLCGIYKLAKNSISLDVKSADYANWKELADCNSAEAINELIDILIQKGYVLHEGSPCVLNSNYKIVKYSIDQDIYNVDYVDWDALSKKITADKFDELVDLIIAKGYVLHKKSPCILNSNYKIIEHSIDEDVYNANFIDWDDLSKNITAEKEEELIDLIIAKGYVLDGYSPIYLADNNKVVLSSLKKDTHNWRYATKYALSSSEVLQYVSSDDCIIECDFWKTIILNVFQDKEILKKCFRQLKIYKSDDKLYRDRIDSLFDKVLNTYPTIGIFNNVFLTNAKENWEEYKRRNANKLENIFGKISSELRNSTNFEKSIYNLEFLVEMKEVLGDQYDDLYKAMKEYFDIYHSGSRDRIELMQPSQDKISYYAALYCGKRRDSYIKEITEKCYAWLKKFFKLRLDNSVVDKKLIQPKRKAKFKELYQEKNQDVISFIDEIMHKYSELLGNDTALRFIEGFVLEDKAKLSEIIEEPNNYDAYLKYEKAARLINRLNLGYISLDGPEVGKYLDVIGYDEEKGMYVYTGISFSDEEKNEILKYKIINQVFETIKREITLKIKEMDIELEITGKEMIELAKELPFTDEYFEFDKKYLSKITLEYLLYGNKFYQWDEESLKDDDAYKLIYNTFVENGIAWLLTFLEYNSCSSISNDVISTDKMGIMVWNASHIVNQAKELNIDLNSFDNVNLLTDISVDVDLKSIAVLGLDIVKILCKNLGFTNRYKKVIVSRAQRLVSKMAGRSMSTVPYVSGETMNYKYSLYDSQDAEVLLAGINTDACFKVCGNDNDFLHYCCLDKNGFVIKITDKDGNFVARASGFRNGNCVFLNQLRTIYDTNGNYYGGRYENETNEIIETLKKSCEDIVRTSQENDLESKKIDYVFVTRSYSLCNIRSDVSKEIENKIGYYPMDNGSRDWKNFIKDNQNDLSISQESDGFTTDYGRYSLICLASVKDVNLINPKDLKFGDVEALYERTRNKIIVIEKNDSNTIRKINRIRGIDSYLNNRDYKGIKVPEGSTVFIGDNWYLVYLNGEIVESCVLEFDEKAKREYELTKSKLDEVTNNLVQQQLANEQNVVYFQNNNDASIYRLNKKL